MRGWLRELDELLRGRKTSPSRLAEGTEHLRMGPFLFAVVVLGLIYGAFMGLYAVLNRTPPCTQQLIASTVKVPLLFLLTLIVTFPSLYVSSALLDTRLSLKGTLRIVVASLAVTLAVLASLGPITGFFSLTTGSYPFIKLLNFAFFAVAGAIGVGFLVKVLRRLEEANQAEAPSIPGAPAALPVDASPAAGSDAEQEHLPLARPVRRKERADRTGRVMRVWLILYGFVGAQMGWVLRPFIGSPNLEFVWFRARESNVFTDVLRTLSELLKG